MRSSDDLLPVRRKCGRTHTTGVFAGLANRESLHDLPGGGIPEPRRAIIAGGEDLLTVRRIDGAIDDSFVRKRA